MCVYLVHLPQLRLEALALFVQMLERALHERVGVEVCVMHELQRRFCALRLACKVYMCVFVCGVGVHVCLTENDWVCMCGVYVWCVCVSH